MKILITTHGNFAEGICSAAKIIVGELKDVTFINAYVDDIDIKNELKVYFAKNDNVLVLTDLFGGSVNQEVMKYKESNHLQIITGINLPLILEILIANNNYDLDLREILEIVDSSKKQIIYVNQLEIPEYKDDF